ncbi:hypothetical protein SAMN05660976_00900 [Nonomuraea pusilla]|uniref:Uncharacterized protein n=2 Tax=Nonomuraea pusilla TaxID=46177 RepID=A0A1H7IVE5_9ACTN|nr:hypothetical protein SAMN05660976_00900 [Nonomuraea pusilla]
MRPGAVPACRVDRLVEEGRRAGAGSGGSSRVLGQVEVAAVWRAATSALSTRSHSRST